MARFPSALRRYSFAVWVLGLTTVGASWLWRSDGRTPSLPLMATLVGLLLLAQALPRHTPEGAKVTPNSVPIFAAMVSLPMGAAVSTVAVGMILAEALGRRPWTETLFNATSTAFVTGLGSLVYTGLAGDGTLWMAITAAAASAVAVHLANVSLVAGAVAAHHSLPYCPTWRAMASSQVGEHALMFLAGGLLGALLLWQPLSGGPLLLVAVVTYIWTRWRNGYPFLCLTRSDH